MTEGKLQRFGHRLVMVTMTWAIIGGTYAYWQYETDLASTPTPAEQSQKLERDVTFSLRGANQPVLSVECGAVDPELVAASCVVQTGDGTRFEMLDAGYKDGRLVATKTKINPLK